MKVLIYTLPLHTNYGGILQAWALKTQLERYGHEVRVAYDGYYFHRHVPIKFIIHACGNWLLHRSDRGAKIFYELSQPQEEKLLRSFKKRHFKWEDREPNKINYKDYDAIIVGSDQIWRPQYVHFPIENSFLDFTHLWDNKRNTKLIRISYAASFGTDESEFSKDEQIKIGHNIQLFDSISVREKSGVALCRELFGVNALHVLDPTMLLQIEDYNNLIKDTPVEEEGIFAYILDRDQPKERLITAIGHVINQKVRYGGSLIGAAAPLSERIQPPIEDWLKGFRDAKFIITDSFHGTVFSLIFHKPFITIGNNARGLSRFHSLFDMFDLWNHYISDPQKFEKSKLQTFKIEDYLLSDKVYGILDEQKKISSEYLLKYFR